jgi:N-acetylglucosamine malate deacetylase 2
MESPSTAEPGIVRDEASAGLAQDAAAEFPEPRGTAGVKRGQGAGAADSRTGRSRLIKLEAMPEPVDGGGGLHGLSLRHACRLAALETELRLLGELSSPASVSGLHPHVSAGSGAVSPHTIVRGRRDPRFRAPPARLEEALEQFGGELDRPTQTAATMIVVAHPDDETVGAGAQLARLEDVVVVHVTDGAPRDPSYARRFGFRSADEYGEARRQETRQALAHAGVPQERQLCLGYSDGEVPYHLVALSLRLAELFDEQRPEVVITHPYEGGHTDHDAIAFGVHLACGVLQREGTPVPVVLELTSYHAGANQRVVHQFLPGGSDAQIRTVRLSPEAAAVKARMYESFATQRDCLAQFSAEVERFRPAPRYVFTRPPHAGTLDYERRCRRMSGAQWRRYAAIALRQLRTRQRGRICTMAPPASRTRSTVRTSITEARPLGG